MNICRVYFHFQPIIKAFFYLYWWSVFTTTKNTTEHVLTWTLRLVKSEIFTNVWGLTLNCSNGASVLLWQTSLSPREIRQQSCSPVRLRHGIDAKSSRGGLMMFQSYPYALLLFFWLSAFARGTWPVHSCCHLTASPPSSHSRGVGGLPTRGSCSCNVNCCSPLWIYAAFVSFSFIYWLKRQNIT